MSSRRPACDRRAARTLTLTLTLTPAWSASPRAQARLRLHARRFDNLTPTFKNINNKFSVKYFLNLVLVDEEDRRYFKQQEVQLWRK